MNLAHTKPTRTIHSSEFVASNDDLLTQILLHLPFISIARFRSVSKHWLSLISTIPEFALPKPVHSLLLHHHSNPSNLHLLRLRRHETTPYVSPFRPLAFFFDASLRCIQSCNGLLLCSQRIDSKITYYVYNPTTLHYATLPPILQELDRELSSPFISIAFDPLTSPSYKVFYFRALTSLIHTFRLAVYSSEAHGWREAEDSFTLRFYPSSYKKGVFWNKAIHWMTRRGSFRFQIEEWAISENPTPRMISDERERGFKYLGVSGDDLYLVKGTGPLRQHLNVYKMEMNYTWSLEHRVDIGNDLAASFPDIIWRNRYRNFCIMNVGQANDDGDEEPFLVVQIVSEVVCYYFKSGRFRKIYELPRHHYDPRNRYLMDIPRAGAYQYMECLSLV